MKRQRIRHTLVVAAALATGCGVFEDPTPEAISFRMSGSAGHTVTTLYSKQFVAGVDELGVTRVEIFGADTVLHVLPFDTIIDIAFERQFFVQVEAMPTDTVDVDVSVAVDGRNLVSQSGGIFPGEPWQYVYQFNQILTQAIEVVF